MITWEGNWKDIFIICLLLFSIIEFLVIIKMRRKKTELTPIVNEVRTALRKHHLQQKQLFKEFDYLLSEIPVYVQSKIKDLSG
ncbi:MAG: hypothetical protein ACHQ1D_01105 [Nitrososphaerales archaeon]